MHVIHKYTGLYSKCQLKELKVVVSVKEKLEGRAKTVFYLFKHLVEQFDFIYMYIFD